MLAAGFVKESEQATEETNAAAGNESTRQWAALEDSLLNGQKWPDWHNIQDVHAFLTVKGALAR